MNVNVLRSQLQYVCNDLNNLTTNDLIECKWITKKKIFQSLLSNSILLKDNYNNLLDLLDKRNNELLQLNNIIKNNNITKEEKLEKEMIFRTNYLRIIVDSLIVLKWPPSMEAFSDPLNDLIHDNNLCLEAMSYIIQIGIPNTIPNLNSNNIANSPLKSSNTSINSPESCNNISKTTLGSRRSSSRVKLRTVESTVSSGITIVNTSESLASNNNSYIDDNTNNQNDSMINNNNDRNLLNQKQYKDFINEPNKFFQSYQMLINKNEILTKQLTTLQERVMKKQEYEIHFESLMNDAIKLIDEINNKQASISIIDTSQLITSTEDKLFIDNIKKEEVTNYRSTLNKSTVNISNKRNNSISSSNSIKINKNSNITNNLINESTNSITSTNTNTSNNSKLSSIKKQLKDVIYQWNDLKKTMISSINHYGSYNNGHNQSIDKVVKPIDIITNNLLTTTNANNYLHKDMLILVSQVNDIISANHTSTSNTILSNGLPLNQSNASTIQSFDQLVMKCQDILLHICKHIPITDNFNNDSNTNKYTTSYEQLSNEINKLMKKLTVKEQQSIQQLLDQTQSEQQTLVRAYTAMRSNCMKWSSACKYTLKQFNSLSKNYKLIFDNTLNYIKGYVDIIQSLVQAFYQAEQSRVAVPNGVNSSSSSNGSKSSPIDILIRGLLGDKIGNVMNIMRLHINDISQISELLQSLYNQLYNEFNNELKNITNISILFNNAMNKTNHIVTS